MTAGEREAPLGAAAQARYDAGRRCLAAGRLHDALREFQAAASLAGEHPLVLEALAMVAGEGGDLAAAERILRHLLQRWPDATREVRLGIVLYRQGRYADALSVFRTHANAVQRNPDLLDAMAYCLQRTGDMAQALAHFRRLFDSAPTPARAMRIVTLLHRAGDHDALAKCLPEFLQRWPDHPDLLSAAAINRLGARDFPAGWRYMRARVGDACDARVAALPRWNGEPFAGSLVIVAEEHLGEAVLMTSALPALAALGQRVLLAIDARLVSLYQRSFPGFTVVPRAGEALVRALASGGDFRRVGSIDLAARFRPEAESPAPASWLCADPVRVAAIREAYRARWPGQRLMGLSWRSLRRFEDDVDRKSLPLAALRRTLSLPGTVFIDLQYGDFREEVAALEGTGLTAPWRDPDIDPTQDIDALAAQLCALDGLVSVSNTTAHIAGALGLPLTVLLPARYPVLWHWCWDGERTPWYPSATLLRGPDGDPDAVDARLATHLAAG